MAGNGSASRSSTRPWFGPIASANARTPFRPDGVIMSAYLTSGWSAGPPSVSSSITRRARDSLAKVFSAPTSKHCTKIAAACEL